MYFEKLHGKEVVFIKTWSYIFSPSLFRNSKPKGGIYLWWKQRFRQIVLFPTCERFHVHCATHDCKKNHHKVLSLCFFTTKATVRLFHVLMRNGSKKTFGQEEILKFSYTFSHLGHLLSQHKYNITIIYYRVFK